MNRGLVNLKELRKNIDKADFFGTTGYCFIDNDKIIKIYAKRGDRGFFIVKDREEVCDLSKFSADTIVFPESYIYEKGKIVGEILKYIKNQSIDKSFNALAKLEKIIDSYEFVINDMYIYPNIDMVDLCYVNILYSNKNGFHLIDTTEWCFKDDSLKKNIFYFNRSLVDAIVEYLEIPISYSKYYNRIDEVYISNIKKYGKAGMQLENQMNLVMHNKFNFLKLLISYMDLYRIYCGNDAETLKDMKEFTKVLKKG